VDPLILGPWKNNGRIFLWTTNNYVKERVDNLYLWKIQHLWTSINPDIQIVALCIAHSPSEIPSPINHFTDDKNNSSLSTINLEKEGELVFNHQLFDERFTFEQFVVGKPNEFAYAAAMRVAESDRPLFNPLFLYGGVGLGKTHLMNAIAWRIRETHPDRKVLYLSAEKFMYEFVKALRYKDTMAFKDLFRSVNVLMIDDVQFISGKETTQEEFFHTFNALVDQNHQIIISADKSPSDLENMEERLKSRMGWGLVADIHPTNYELRLGILENKASSLKIEVPKEVKEFLALKISSNVRELEGALNRIVAHATFIGRPITLDSAQEVLRDILRIHDCRIDIEEIQRRVAEYYNIKMSDIISTKRQQNIARTRQIAMFFCKTLTTKSLPEIGRKFGGRDHTTVLHAIRRIEEICKEDTNIANDIEVLRRSLQNAF
jgi:chromosomal replication initiator protein